MNDLSGLLGRVGERKDILLVVLLLAVVFMMVLPLPPLLLDILIAVNITISVVLLMMSVYIGSPTRPSSPLRSFIPAPPAPAPGRA
ncbi:hypothetical protein FA147_29405, partial [Pseudomonas aeruginosa]|nr:hypothetical protein [Pseudomonas aeruginosa]